MLPDADLVPIDPGISWLQRLGAVYEPKDWITVGRHLGMLRIAREVIIKNATCAPIEWHEGTRVVSGKFNYETDCLEAVVESPGLPEVEDGAMPPYITFDRVADIPPNHPLENIPLWVSPKWETSHEGYTETTASIQIGGNVSGEDCAGSTVQVTFGGDPTGPAAGSTYYDDTQNLMFRKKDDPDGEWEVI
jgi:hypothetical protein